MVVENHRTTTLKSTVEALNTLILGNRIFLPEGHAGKFHHLAEYFALEMYGRKLNIIK